MRIACYGDSLTEGVPGVSVLEQLAAMLPEHELENRGRRGDTVLSLHRRIEREPSPREFDVAVLWVGVNDVLAKVSTPHALLKRLMRQPPARTLDAFRSTYESAIAQLHGIADRVLAVSPLLIGEDLSNRWNRKLRGLGQAIASVAASFERVAFLDLQALVAPRLAEGESSDYVPRRVTTIARDTLFLRSAHAVDAAATRRGLRLTLDGLHLNTAGARVVADALRQSLEALVSLGS